MGFFAAQSVVLNTTKEFVPAAAALPKVVQLSMAALQKVRSVWSWYQYGNMYANPENFIQLASGHILQATLGNRQCIQVAALCVLISARLSDCIERQKALCRSYDKLLNCWRGDYPLIDFKEPTLSRGVLNRLAPSLDLAFFSRYRYLKAFYFLLIKRIYHLAKELFHLSMAIAATAESFSFSVEVRQEAVNLFFIHGFNQLVRLSETGEEILAKLRFHTPLIDKVFIKLNSPYRTIQIIGALETVVFATRIVATQVQNVRSVINGSFVDALRGRVLRFMGSMGLSHILPESFCENPSPLPLWNASLSVHAFNYVEDALLKRLTLRPVGEHVRRITRTVTQVYEQICGN